MKCNECNETDNLIEFARDTREPSFYLCEGCWDAKIYKGIERRASLETYSKHFVPSKRTGRK